MPPALRSFSLELIMMGNNKHVIYLLFISIFVLSNIIRDSNAKSSNTTSTTFEDYLELRKKLIDQENESFLGSEIELTQNENLFNELLMSRKIAELDSSFQTAEFPPSQPFYNVKDRIGKYNTY